MRSSRRRLRLTLGLAASQLLDLFLGGTARGGPLGLGSGLLAGSALDFLSFQLVFNLGGVQGVPLASSSNLSGISGRCALLC